MTVDEQFGVRVRALRRARQLTQQELAERAGLSVDSVRRIEKGAFSPSLETIGKLASGLDISLQTLFQGLEHNPGELVAIVGDYLARRTGAEVRRANRVLRALFDLVEKKRSRPKRAARS